VFLVLAALKKEPTPALKKGQNPPKKNKKIKIPKRKKEKKKEMKEIRIECLLGIRELQFCMCESETHEKYERNETFSWDSWGPWPPRILGAQDKILWNSRL
jgi:hypothetical protein